MSTVKIFYGARAFYENVTQKTLESLYDVQTGKITIPAGDENRAAIFGDPCPFVEKSIIIYVDGIPTNFSANMSGEISIGTNLILEKQSPPENYEEMASDMIEYLQPDETFHLDHHLDLLLSRIQPTDRVLILGCDFTTICLGKNYLNTSPMVLDPYLRRVNGFIDLCDLNRYTPGINSSLISITQHRIQDRKIILKKDVNPKFPSIKVSTVLLSSIQAQTQQIFNVMIVHDYELLNGFLYDSIEDFLMILSNIDTIFFLDQQKQNHESYGPLIKSLQREYKLDYTTRPGCVIATRINSLSRF